MPTISPWTTPAPADRKALCRGPRRDPGEPGLQHPGPSPGPSGGSDTATGGGQEKVAVLVSPTGIQGEYAKTRLVPFGEYIPFRNQLGWLTDISHAASSNMIPGTGAHTLTVTTTPNGKPLTIGVLICFESAFPDMSRVETDQGAQVIVYQSSTPTFQGTWGPDQHASLSRAARRGDRPPGRPGRADRGHGGLRRPGPGARVARPGQQRRGHGPP